MRRFILSPRGGRERADEIPPTGMRPSARVRYGNVQHLLHGAAAPGKDVLKTYWKKVGKRALPYLANRPLTLVRHENGRTFFHTGALPAFARGVRAMSFEKREGGEGVRAYVDSVQGLIGLVDMDVVEVHPWNARVDDIEHADQMVFDLDPGHTVDWDVVTGAALRLRDFLGAARLESWPKATGGKGLHVMVPLKIQGTHDEVRALAHLLAERFAATDPGRYTISSTIAGRAGKIFVDYLRNGRGQTGIGAYSPRARPNFPIAAPLDWDEVARGLPTDAYTIDRLPA